MRWKAAVLILALIAATGWLIQAGVLYQTGQQWFEACWTQAKAKRSPSTPQEAIAWGQCEPIAERSVYQAGYLFSADASMAVTPQAKALANSCPSSYSDMPIAGINLFVVLQLERDGGPTWSDRFLPPNQMIVRVFESRWPDCPNVRKAEGYPMLIQHADGWRWEKPCMPCENELKARGIPRSIR